MIRFILAEMALATPIPAQPRLWCKNSEGESLAWKIGEARPANMAQFGNAENVVCLVNAQIYRDIAAGALGLRDFPVQANTPSSLVAGPTGAGAIYRGNWARWLIDNLPAAYGVWADWAYFVALQP